MLVRFDFTKGWQRKDTCFININKRCLEFENGIGGLEQQQSFSTRTPLDVRIAAKTLCEEKPRVFSSFSMSILSEKRNKNVNFYPALQRREHFRKSS